MRCQCDGSLIQSVIIARRSQQAGIWGGRRFRLTLWKSRGSLDLFWKLPETGGVARGPAEMFGGQRHLPEKARGSGSLHTAEKRAILCNSVQSDAGHRAMQGTHDGVHSFLVGVCPPSSRFSSRPRVFAVASSSRSSSGTVGVASADVLAGTDTTAAKAAPTPRLPPAPMPRETRPRAHPRPAHAARFRLGRGNHRGGRRGRRLSSRRSGRAGWPA